MEKASIGSCFQQQAKRHMEKSRAQPFPQGPLQSCVPTPVHSCSTRNYSKIDGSEDDSSGGLCVPNSDAHIYVYPLESLVAWFGLVSFMEAALLV